LLIKERNMTKNLSIPSVVGSSVLHSILGQIYSDPLTTVKQSTSGYPISDLYKDEDGNQLIEVALAGFSKEELSVEVKDNTISISSQPTSPSRDSSRIARRRFTRTFVDYDYQLNLKAAEVTFENGLLKVVIPPTEDSKATTINIK
jgi:molecular chaperone IbpA